MPGSLGSDHAVLQVGDAGRVDDALGLQLEPRSRQVVQWPLARAEQHGRDVQLQLVDQARPRYC